MLTYLSRSDVTFYVVMVYLIYLFLYHYCSLLISFYVVINVLNSILYNFLSCVKGSARASVLLFLALVKIVR